MPNENVMCFRRPCNGISRALMDPKDMESSLGHLPPQLLHRPKGVAGGYQLHSGATPRAIFRFKWLGLDEGIN